MKFMKICTTSQLPDNIFDISEGKVHILMTSLLPFTTMC